MRRILTLCLFFAPLLLTQASFAEPWLANRFSQNCAACHSPGRVNVPTADRRCTLTCQGCHVNPNGGGLRSEHGKWNERRWLSTFSNKNWKLQGERFAPYAEQPYADQNIRAYVDSVEPSAGSPKRKEVIANVIKEGVPLKTQEEPMIERNYDRKNGANEELIEKDRNKFWARIPFEDPRREKERNVILAGGDMRVFYVNSDKNDVKTVGFFPMAADVGATVRFFRKLSMVTEARFGGFKPKFDQLYTTNAFARSAYLIVDDLPFNSYVMSGLYRPMFGTYNPDHNSLASTMTGQGFKAVYNAFGIGTAPNAAFLNVNFIQRQANLTDEASASIGMAASAGLRFIPYGASVVASLWNTRTRDSDSVETGGRVMSSLSLGMNLGDWITGVDFMRIAKSTTSSSDEGSVVAWENRFRLKGETYLQGHYSISNTTVGWCTDPLCANGSLKPGNGSEMQVGIRSFLLAGMDAEIMYVNRVETVLEPYTSTVQYNYSNKMIQGQFHFYY